MGTNSVGGVSLEADKLDASSMAHKLTSRGLVDKAILEWQKLLSGTPKDGDVHNTIGDLHLRVNHRDDAISAYLKAAEIFKNSGFDLKCAALLKKIIKVDPSRVDVCERLADVHAGRGLTGDAHSNYLKAADYYARRGENDAVLLVYQKMLRLDPGNAELHVNLAETYDKLGRSEEAIEACETALSSHSDRPLREGVRHRIEQILKRVPSAPHQGGTVGLPPPSPSEDSGSRQVEAPSFSERMHAVLRTGDWEGAQNIFETMTAAPEVQFRCLAEWFDALLRNGSDVKAFVALRKAISVAEEHTAHLDEARGLLQRYIEAHPEQLSAYELLAETLEKLGETREACPIYEKILSLSLTQGDIAAADTYYEMMKVKCPEQCLDWKDRFEPAAQCVVLEEGTSANFVVESSSEPSDAPKSPDLVPDAVPEHIEEAPPLLFVEAYKPADASEVAGGEVAQDRSEVIFNSYLREADVYEKYKLYSKAAERLRSLVLLSPGRVEPYLRLKEIYLRAGMIEQAVETCLALMGCYEAQGMDDQKQSLLNALSEMDPGGVYHTPQTPVQSADSVQAMRQPNSPDVCAEGLPEPEEVEPAVSTTEPSPPAQDAMELEPFQEQSLPPWVSQNFIQAVSLRFGSSVSFPPGGPPPYLAECTPDMGQQAPPESLLLSEPSDAPVEISQGEIVERSQEATCMDRSAMEAHYHLGVSYREMGLMHEAMDEMRFILRGDALFQEASCLLARCYQDMDLHREAIEGLRNAMADSRCADADMPIFRNQMTSLQNIPELGTKSDQHGEASFTVTSRSQDTETGPDQSDPGTKTSHPISNANRQRRKKITYV